MQAQITLRHVIEEETEELGEKPLHRPPRENQSTKQSIGIQGWERDPSRYDNGRGKEKRLQWILTKDE